MIRLVRGCSDEKRIQTVYPYCTTSNRNNQTIGYIGFDPVGPRSMKRCPKCGTIVSDNIECGVCGADLWNTQDEPLGIAVSEAQKQITLEKEQDKIKDLHTVRKQALIRLLLCISGVAVTFTGVLVILYMPFLFSINVCFRYNLSRCGPFGLGWVIFALGISILLTATSRGRFTYPL